jgi:hypothetical protein
MVMARGHEAPLGAQRTSANGYRYEKTLNGWELIHRLIAVEQLKRPLRDNEYVSFADGDRTNLNPENIVVRQRGKTSLRRRAAQLEARIQELVAARDEILSRIETREKLGS